MKKLYFLLFTFLISAVSIGQTFSDDFNYPDSQLLNANGWNAFSGAGTNAIDVGVSSGLTYAGYSGTTGFTAAVEGNAAILDNTGEDVNRTFAAPVTSGTLYSTFLVKVVAAATGYFTGFTTTGTTFGNRIFYKPSTTAGKINFGISNTSTAVYGTTDYDLNTTYLIIVKYDVSATGSTSMWIKSSGIPATELAAGTPEVTNSGSGSATISGIFLRQFDPSQNIIIDAYRVYPTWFNATACPLALDSGSTACDAVTSAIDTYTATIPFTGGGTQTYNLSSNFGTISGDNPSTNATGNIIISGISEGTDIELTVSGGCNLSKILIAPECKAINSLPYYEGFDYANGSALGKQQKWTNVNTGDEILAATGNLTYTGLTSSGNSVKFDGIGFDVFSPITDTSTGTLYYSFLLNISSMAGVTDTNGGYFAGFSAGTTNLGATLWGVRVDDTSYNLGIEVRTATGTATTLTSSPFATGQTHLIVVAYRFNETTTSDDIVDLWIDPVIGAAEPTATISDSHTGTDLTNINNFFLRQDSPTETGFVQIDELRIGTSWAQVTTNTLSTNPLETNNFKIYPNPTNLGYVNISSKNNAKMDVSVFDILGKQVIKETIKNNRLNTSKLNAGVYILKVAQDNASITKKLVIK